MKDHIRENLTNPNIWVRVLNMVLFMFAYGLAKAILVFVAFFQLISILITGRANLPLLIFGKNLSVFIYEILEFQTFNTEIRPFPFSPWPEEDHGGDIWLDDAELNQESFAEEEVVEEKNVEEKNAEEIDEEAPVDSESNGDTSKSSETIDDQPEKK